MSKTDIEKMGREDITYTFILCKMKLYNEKIEKLTLYRRHNAKGRLVATVGIYYADQNGNARANSYRLYDEEYVWFLNHFTNDFPDIPFWDLTDEDKKIAK